MKNIFKISALASSALLALATPAIAKHHGEASEPATANHDAAMDAIINADIRDGDKARDKYRNPAKTLAFMGLTPEMNVGEYAPGGGWYSRVIAPYVAEKGKFTALYFDPKYLPYPEERKEAFRAQITAFPEKLSQWTGKSADSFSSFVTPNAPAEHNGSMDFIFIPRMMHNLMRWNIADSEIKAMRDLLKEEGKIGIVQHRAKADAPYALSDGNKGYMREADIIALMTINGFELVKSSEINANPKDSADYEGGVWTLPPSMRSSKDDADARAKYQAIGESDRMTLLFKKRP